ncbi:MAG: GNAT family N-acetyltransferase [Bacteroidia bacterium]|nr:GNAT family N-acetyltransferase [Bacteroidia bacterium]
MKIEQLTAIDESTIEAFQKLIPQLTEDPTRFPTRQELEKAIQSEDTLIFTARENGQILGTTTLVLYRIPSGIKAWIEDVVVDENARGKGVSVALVSHALNVAREIGVEKVDLTSQPFRVAANNLYKKLGFQLRETNVYRFTI